MGLMDYYEHETIDVTSFLGNWYVVRKHYRHTDFLGKFDGKTGQAFWCWDVSNAVPLTLEKACEIEKILKGEK